MHILLTKEKCIQIWFIQDFTIHTFNFPVNFAHITDGQRILIDAKHPYLLINNEIHKMLPSKYPDNNQILLET